MMPRICWPLTLRLLPKGSYVRTYTTKPNFKTIMRKKLAQLDSLFLTGVTRFHEITGYSEIERIKDELTKLEENVDKTRATVKAAKESYDHHVSQRSTSQREMNELLMRKPTWVATDLERFTQLYKDDHRIQVGVEESKKEYDRVESHLDELQQLAGKLIGARYREEQMFSDRIRQASTWGTWVLTVINVLLFLIVQLFLEPWKRKGLIRSFEARVQHIFDSKGVHLVNNEGESIDAKHIIAGNDTDIVNEPGADEPENTTGEISSNSSAAYTGANNSKFSESLQWSNLPQRISGPELVVRPVELCALTLGISLLAGMVPLFALAISGR